MKALFLLLFVGALAVTPLYMFDSVVMPELLSIQQAYSSASEAAEQAVVSPR
jgi:hypothetical protein